MPISIPVVGCGRGAMRIVGALPPVEIVHRTVVVSEIVLGPAL